MSESRSRTDSPHPVPLELELEPPPSPLTAAPESACAHPTPQLPQAFSIFCQNLASRKYRASTQWTSGVWHLASKSQINNMLKQRWGKSCLSLPSLHRSDEATWTLGSPRSRLLTFKSGSMCFYQLSSRPMHALHIPCQHYSVGDRQLCPSLAGGEKKIQQKLFAAPSSDRPTARDESLKLLAAHIGTMRFVGHAFSKLHRKAEIAKHCGGAPARSRGNENGGKPRW